jgi:uncharacterized membrane protein YcaP (DUF421 family)
MFHLEPSVLEKILRPVIIYLFILVALRIGGQREISQTSALQLVLLLSVANAVQNGIIGTDDSVSGAIIGAATLFTVNGIVEILASRSPRIHSLVVGRPVELVTRGTVNTHVLRRHRISVEDLTQAAIAAGGESVHDIEKAQLSPSGTIDVVLHSAMDLRNEIRLLTTKIDRLLGQ